MIGNILGTLWTLRGNSSQSTRALSKEKNNYAPNLAPVPQVAQISNMKSSIILAGGHSRVWFSMPLLELQPGLPNPCSQYRQRTVIRNTDVIVQVTPGGISHDHRLPLLSSVHVRTIYQPLPHRSSLLRNIFMALYYLPLKQMCFTQLLCFLTSAVSVCMHSHNPAQMRVVSVNG